MQRSGGRCASSSALLAFAVLLFGPEVEGLGNVGDNDDTAAALRRASTFRVLRELYDATGGDQWLIPSGEKKWNFTTQAFGTDDYCTWHGVICCAMDEGAVDALQAGAIISAGRSAWSTYMSTAYATDDQAHEEDVSFSTILRSESDPSFQERHQTVMIADCPNPKTITGLVLPNMDLHGTLPSSISDLPVQVLDVSGNPRLFGMVPTGLRRPSFWGLSTKGSSLNCHNNTLSDAEAIALAQRLHSIPPQEWLSVDWSYGAQLCLEALGAPVNDEWVVNQTTADIKTLCQSAFLPGSNAILSIEYVLTYGCPCPAGTNKVFRSSNGRVQHFCSAFQYMWMVETMTFVLMLFYICGVLYRVAARKQSLFVKWVKRSCQPGYLPIEGGSLSWTEGMMGLITRPRLNSPAPHPCFVAMCTVKDIQDILERLDFPTAAAALACYRGVCERSLSHFCGWKLRLRTERSCDKSRLLYGFHELSDALAWAVHTQDSLLHAAWPEALTSCHVAQTIFHRDEDCQWRELFAGLRVAIAVSQRTLTLRSCLGRVLEVSSHGMADVEALLAIANVCQIVTVEDIKTLEDIKERLGHSRAGPNHKQTLKRSASTGARPLQQILISLHKHDDPAQGGAPDVTTGLNPVIIDLGKHLIQQPSHHPQGCIVNVQQLTSSRLYHQSYVTGLRTIPSICCMQPTFWQAPGAREFCERKRGTAVVMVFTCFADYQSLYQPGMQDAAEGAVTIFKGCVQQALDIADGYECQEVNAVFMLTFHTPTDAILFHLVLQQLLLISEWTPDMLALPPMKPEWSDSGDLLFRGPRVKTGVYQGEPRSITPHSTTGRADYWGPLVNRAARMMAGARGGQLLCMKEVADEALDAKNVEPPHPNSWHVLAFKSDKSVLLRNGEATTICEPAIPYRFDREAPEELAEAWLGTRLALACKHSHDVHREDAGRDSIDTESNQEEHDLSRPEHQLNYTHEVQVHDMGLYRFKGIVTDFSIKSINLAALAGRNAGYVGGLKSSKAKQVAVGRGHERSVLLSMPTPAVMLERLNWQSEMQDDKCVSSRGSAMLAEVDMEDYQVD